MTPLLMTECISFVKLVMNFRSNQHILKFPNEKFYNGDLQACGDPVVIDHFLDQSILVNRHFPVIFHGIVGKDDREASSPSFFNIDEILEVKSYVKLLKEKYRISEYFSPCSSGRRRLVGQRITTLAS
jgi:helicase MOV-10